MVSCSRSPVSNPEKKELWKIWFPPKEAVSDDTNYIQDEPWWKCMVEGGALWVSVTEGTAGESTGLEAGPCVLIALPGQ